MPRFEKGLFRFAWGAAFLTYLLLSVGGIVTSLDAGMVFLDWPLSNGSVNPEGWLRDPDKMSEHGHRILGALVGLATIVLAVRLQRRDPRRPVRILGWVAVGSVSVQGLLGGLRVTEVSTELALLHGCAGQLFFCLMIGLAYVLSRDAFAAPEPGPDTRGLSICASGAVFAVAMQIVLGAQLRHVGGPLDAHLLGAVFVGGLAFWLVTAVLLRHGGRRALTRPALLLGALVLVQVGLGLASASTLRTYRAGNPTFVQVLLPTIHQSVGALMLATAVVLCLRAFRRVQAAPFPQEAVA